MSKANFSDEVVLLSRNDFVLMEWLLGPKKKSDFARLLHGLLYYIKLKKEIKKRIHNIKSQTVSFK